MKTLLVLLSVFAIQNVSVAQTSGEELAMQGALDARNEFVTALTNKDFTAITHHGFDVAIRELAQTLIDEQHDQALSDELLAQWTQSSLNFEALVFASTFDLGDHAPLFQWIEDFLQKTSMKYGTVIYMLPIVKNIETMNFAIPVVFKPQGSWQVNGANNRVEYRKHFIPFANLITYYVALYGCNYIVHREAAPQLKKLCKPAAEKLRFVMGRYIAPMVSDWIFKAGNRNIQIGPSRLRYNTAEELAQAIQHN